jgi:hypothetical protein
MVPVGTRPHDGAKLIRIEMLGTAAEELALKTNKTRALSAHSLNRGLERAKSPLLATGAFGPILRGEAQGFGQAARSKVVVRPLTQADVAKAATTLAASSQAEASGPGLSRVSKGPRLMPRPRAEGSRIPHISVPEGLKVALPSNPMVDLLLGSDPDDERRAELGEAARVRNEEEVARGRRGGKAAAQQ